MKQFFTHERYGRPQVIAATLLLVFLGQCLWLIAREAHTVGPSGEELFRIQTGLRLWHGQPALLPPNHPAFASESEALGLPVNGVQDREHSRLWYLIAAAPLLAWPAAISPETFKAWVWPARLPYLLFGTLLGASLWYVARRLYGNAGGYIALTLYCFSPVIIRSTSLWSAQPEIGAAWGTFGAVFTAIAVAHTLYAPREVVLWNWRRTLLLGLSFTLAVGSQFSLIVVVPLALAFMLYVAHMRKGAAIVIWAAALAFALALLFASYSFRPNWFHDGMAHADFLGPVFLGSTWRAPVFPRSYFTVLKSLAQAGPALIVALPVALGAYVAWPRTRYFGNTAPLLVAMMFLLLSFGFMSYQGLGFQLMVVPFLFVFISGVTADLLETRYRDLVLGCIWGLLLAHALWNLLSLGHLTAE